MTDPRSTSGKKQPISIVRPAAKIEELIQQLKTQYTIVIVTHNMQQAGRVSDFTGFFYLGRLVEFATTEKMRQKTAYGASFIARCSLVA